MWWNIAGLVGTMMVIFVVRAKYRLLAGFLSTLTALTLCGFAGNVLWSLEYDSEPLIRFLVALNFGLSGALLVGGARGLYLSSKWRKRLPFATTDAEREKLWPAESARETPSVLKTVVVAYTLLCVLGTALLVWSYGLPQGWPTLMGGFVSLCATLGSFVATKRRIWWVPATP
ncbi:MAG TPA: hypothetical protein VFO38_05000 [Candidatus Saccharimonadales bacterium]|nr:hypothetical protein [Candidatus Saccharimonadales bacterium]